MNEKAKKLWIDTLRSETVKQGRNRLCRLKDNEYYFCCLGVLCEIYQSESQDPKNKLEPLEIFKAGSSEIGFEFSYDDNYGGLPSRVREWADINNSFASFENEHNQYSDLVHLNDGFNGLTPKTFIEIADVIEKYF